MIDTKGFDEEFDFRTFFNLNPPFKILLSILNLNNFIIYS